MLMEGVYPFNFDLLSWVCRELATVNLSITARSSKMADFIRRFVHIVDN